MALHCPFCHSLEEDRVLAEDSNGELVTLLLFDCPFFIRVEQSRLDSEKNAQAFLDTWKDENGNDWLETIGPLLKERELKNTQQFWERQASGE